MSQPAALHERDRNVRLVNRVTILLAGCAALATAVFGFAAAHAKATRHGSTSPASSVAATPDAATDDSSGGDGGFFATPSQPPSQSFAPPAAVSGGS